MVMQIFLIGSRGTGKSTVARHLAAALGRDWVDADVEIERRAGKSIAEIFADDGEPIFRELEAQVVADLAARPSGVVALGGGAVLREATRELLRRSGQVIWLTATPETLWKRISTDATTADRRPNLTPTGGITEIIALLAARAPIYRQCADLEVDTEEKTPERIAAEIVAWLQWTGGQSRASAE